MKTNYVELYSNGYCFEILQAVDQMSQITAWLSPPLEGWLKAGVVFL